VKNLFQFTVAVLLFGSVVLPTQAYTSLYIFGDALSSTIDTNFPGSSLYYGQRYSNGRVWVEVLAQRQGLTYDATKNNSYYDHNSADLVTEINNFTAPPDVTNDLFIVWVCNADTFDAACVPDNAAQWTAAINQSQINHLQIITSLYAKGVRALILPNAVDISEIPAFNNDSVAGVMHNGCVAYDVAFSNTISQAMALCPGLKIYTPDYFTLLNNMLTNAAYYGLTNALINYGQGDVSIDAIDYLYPACNTNGPGTNYIFWDNMDPTAKLHEVMADVAQQLVSPVQISQLTVLNGSNRLDVANIPVGLNGFVDGSTNLVLANWTSLQNITSTNTKQSIFILTAGSLQNSLRFSPMDGPPPLPGPGDPGASGSNSVFNSTAQFYRLQFPYTWTWP
jgi:phospholipase/lecithinase/hemolysin